MADMLRYETDDDNDRISSLSQFPDELILEILSYLDVDDLLVASRVCQHPLLTCPDPFMDMDYTNHSLTSND